MTKHIFVTGGVVSSLGKGLTSASIGMLLERRGLNVRMQKLDPYINVDPGTMSPYQHGEVYVLDDGSETDLDLGHYERFTNSPLTRDSNYTTGQIYQAVIEKERRGEFLGKTVQVIPHITDEIKRVIRKLATDDVDVVITEIGGTVGDIESLPFLEAIRQMSQDVGRENCLYIHLTLVPVPESRGRTQDQAHAAFRGAVASDWYPTGYPDLSHRAIDQPGRPAEDCPVLQCAAGGRDRREGQGFFDLRGAAESGQQRLGPIDRQKLQLRAETLKLDDWHDLLHRLRNPQHEISIAVVGKYAEHKDAYKSIYESLDHAGIQHHTQIRVGRIQSEEVEREGPERILTGYDGILVPGGFGERGIEGKVDAIRFARERQIPFLGICLGMQCAVIEFARNVVKLENAHSTEFSKDTHAPGHLPVGRSEEDHGKGRHDATGHATGRVAAGEPRCRSLRKRADFGASSSPL